jgi:hypothetical protein
MRAVPVGGIMAVQGNIYLLDRRVRRMKETEATSATEGTALRSLLGDTATLAAGFLEELPGRRVTPSATVDELREEFGGPLPGTSP